MTASNHLSMTALLAVGQLLLGCASHDVETQAELNVSGLTETKTVAACSKQVLTVEAAAAGSTSVDYSWNVTGPVDAAYSSSSETNALHFTARTPGEYLISVSACRGTESSAVACDVTEFGVTVELGDDLNHNGIGDLCEADSCTPACDARQCGLDPVCGVSCGTCGAGQSCNDVTGQCEAECVPACEGRTCGKDPICGKSCGTCGAGQTCDEARGQCQAECVPACDGRTCGLDPVCHTSCGTCGDGSSCNSEGQCEAAATPGKVVTIVMALTDKRLGFTDPHFKQRTRLIEQSVQWVSPVPNPKVLVVLDDIAPDHLQEARRIVSAMKERRFSATLLSEPKAGLSAVELSTYDVVWFSNPDLALDDPQTIAALQTFAQNGGGVVLQGDNMTQPSSLEALTGLHYVSDGKYACGQYIDDDRGASYRVSIERVTHPIVTNLAGNTYYYGDDIDASTLIAGPKTSVLAWASAGACHHSDRANSKCAKQPVIVAHELE